MYTLNQCKNDMLKLWGILKDDPRIYRKSVAIAKMSLDSTIEASRFERMNQECPCCHYAERMTVSILTPVCYSCPIWGGEDAKRCHHDNGEFTLWLEAETNEERKKWATAIYNLALAIDTTI